MTIQHCDNFGVYGAIAHMTDGVYAQILGPVALTADPDGISSGSVIGLSSFFANECQVRFVLPTAQTVMGHAMRTWLTAIPPDTDNENNMLFSYRDASNNSLIYARYNTIGGIDVWQGGFGVGAVLRGSTVGPVVTANGWWHVESKVDTVAGTVEIRVEGSPVSWLAGGTQITGLAFAGSTIQQVALTAIGGNSSPHMYVKDLVWWDGSGTHNNDFLGSVLVALLSPASDVSLNWTPTPALTPGYQILRNVPPQDGVQFIDAPNPPPSPYVCTMTDLSADVTSVKCIMTMVRAAKTDGGDASLQVGVISSPSAGPVTGLGVNRPITVAQTYWRDVFEVDPKTTASWLPSAVNAANLQINRTV